MKTDENLVDIDELALDKEWLVQAKRMRKYGDKLASARKEHAEAKANLSVVEADLSLKIREDPAAYNLPKATEGSIGSAVVLQAEYKAAMKQLIETKYAVDIFESATTALEHRKRALENLVSLHGMQYFGEPKEPDNAKGAGERFRKSGRKPLKNKEG